MENNHWGAKYVNFQSISSNEINSKAPAVDYSNWFEAVLVCFWGCECII